MRMRNRLLTDAAREILHTKKKFFSLLIMNFLAVGFLAGLRGKNYFRTECPRCGKSFTVKR